MARSEFGRVYVDEQQRREVERSLARGKGGHKPRPTPDAAGPLQASAEAALKPKPRPKLWHQPSVRERRSELAQARARIAEAARARKSRTPDEPR